MIKNYSWDELAYAKIEDSLIEKIAELNWNTKSNATFEELYEQTKNRTIDYRYFLLIAKTANNHFRDYDDIHNYNLIDIYYKSLFLNLAIENGTNLNSGRKDSLKLEYTNQYILATLIDSCFHSNNDFKDFANYNIKYSLEALNSKRLSLRKDERSELYWIIADANYRINYIGEENQQSLSEVLRYLSLAIKENPKNWRAIKDRAAYNGDLGNYKAAINDYLLWLKVTEANNKEAIDKKKKWISNHTANEIKNINAMWSNWDFGNLTSPTFTGMVNIAECYLNLSDYKNVLLWCDKAILAIEEYKKYNKNQDELTSQYEGEIYYDKALAHFKLKEFTLACSEIGIAINNGYDLEECNKLQLEINCNSATLPIGTINSISMTKKGGVYEIPVTINDVLKLNFIFDAGAADVSISPDVALTLIRTGTVNDKDFIGTETYRFADGTSAKSKVFIVREIQLGNKKIYNVKASISSSINAPLLLGQSVLNKFGKITINYNKGVILFD